MKYWNRLVNMNFDRLPKKAFLESMHLYKRGGRGWVTSVLRNLNGMWIPLRDPHPLNVNTVLDNFRASVKRGLDLNMETGSIKLQTYSLMIGDSEYAPRKYLQEVKDNDELKCLARFRTGSHWLRIQTGRYFKEPRENRVCRRCNEGYVEE